VTWHLLVNAALAIVLFDLVLFLILWARNMQIETRLRADQARRVGIRPD